MKNNIKVKRAELNLTQQDLADQLAVSRQTVNAIEKGKYDPSLPIAFKLANVFQCAIEDLFQPE
ncbi:MAG: helix-turn-helix transcriptional regulator [Gammaproteobacteria bacterium]|nr:helix-turn-helix transcriptional regulator [Gammaproteobacteria bacterium]NVK89462.1 helix-turn-helix transcriptional regulator [Gammaproteobacteria bacterium]